jgi:hypothetical protein
MHGGGVAGGVHGGFGVGCAVALAKVGMAVSGAVDMVVVEATGNQIVESILKEEKLNGGK